MDYSLHHGGGGINFIVPEQRNPSINASTKLETRVGRHCRRVEESAVLGLPSYLMTFLALGLGKLVIC